MKLLCKKLNVTFKKAQSGIEFLVVFSILLLFFVVIADIGLFFKAIYTTQAVADEALARLAAANQCAEQTQVEPILIRAVQSYNAGWVGHISFAYLGDDKGGMYTSNDERRRFQYTIKCRTSHVPSSVVFTFRHYGLFMFLNGKHITSNVSTNTTF